MELSGKASEVRYISDDVAAQITKAQVKFNKTDFDKDLCSTAFKVIVSASSAVGQLIDNSLDACAQTIEIRLKNNGFESIEVIDDGTGIEADSFPSVCKPHSTSKLTGLDDLSQVVTLGFRGEALNALCALASVTLISRSESASLGTKLSFDHSGNIVDQSSVVRPIGTTIIIERLFETLPVRRKEFEKTVKKHLGRILTTVQCFSLSRPDVKFICSNTLSGKRMQLICTTGRDTIQELIYNLFGGRNDKNRMVGIVQCLPNDEVCSMYGLDKRNNSMYSDIVISGFVSSCEHGCGRSTADRQFVYVNKRPVDYPKICRVINEVYQQYNRSQYPTVVLYIELPPGMVDVNVTPDKRVVFFEQEKELLAIIRSSFLATFHPLLGSYISTEEKNDSRLPYNERCESAIATNNSSSLSSIQRSTPLPPRSSSAKTVPLFADVPQAKRSKTENCASRKSLVNCLKTLDDFSFKPLHRDNCVDMVSSKEPVDHRQEKPEESRSLSVVMKRSSDESSMKTSASELSDMVNCSHVRKKFNPPLMRNLSRGFENSIEKDNIIMEKMEEIMNQKEISSGISNEKQGMDQQANTPTVQAIDQPSTFFRPQQKIIFSMTALKQRISSLRGIKAKEEQSSQDLHFSAALLPAENDTAEEELNRALRKSDFCQMSVIGQFNKGFIITLLRNHLFIIDQHASDEKYNFERFQKKARVDTQRLIHPKSLELGAVQALTLRDNKEIFEANGFGFEFKNGEDGNVVPYLVSIPVLHSWNFDKSDIEEILAVVSEFPGVMYRPAKLRRIFASRACRKSVMIGTVLNTNQMKKITEHLGTLDQPWNCPHGRPTLRHLVDLQNIK
ncbi:DNA mismatch repair protein [Dictyocaulus viviparus]|uniref:DNA mismatch repair protein n=1 Tax=Dictyocaulus viviparus TaxID=29172 RepID=A0A0D8Y9X8_DICVI|nr:DNA mismatch repair protein [Dictyocaulus viviparus]